MNPSQTPNRRQFMALGSACAVAAWAPTTSLMAAAGQGERWQSAHVVGSQDWLEDGDARLARLLSHGSAAGELRFERLQGRAGRLQGPVRLELHVLGEPGGDVVSAHVTQLAPWDHAGRYVAMTYNRDSVQPLSAPVGFDVWAHGDEGILLELGWGMADGPHQTQRVQLGGRHPVALRAGVTVLALARPDGTSALALALVIRGDKEAPAGWG